MMDEEKAGSIDAHAHWTPEGYVRAAAELGRKVSGGPLSPLMFDLVGSDRVVIGTDNYAKVDVEQPNALVEQLQLPAADRERILRGNAAKLLRP
jgi:predicted TIM-barrel fold metal-dependent hydrolase